MGGGPGGMQFHTDCIIRRHLVAFQREKYQGSRFLCRLNRRRAWQNATLQRKGLDMVSISDVPEGEISKQLSMLLDLLKRLIHVIHGDAVASVETMSQFFLHLYLEARIILGLDLNKRAFNYSKDHPRRSTQRSSHRHKSFSILTWIRRTSRQVVHAMRDFVQCLTSDTDTDSSCYRDDDMASTSISLETPPVCRQHNRDQRPSTAKKTRYEPPRHTRSSGSQFRSAPGFVEEPDSKQRAMLSRVNKSRNPHTVVEEQPREPKQPSVSTEADLLSSCDSEVPSTSTSTSGPKLPLNFFQLSTNLRLRAVKQYLSAFEYRQDSETTFIANKLRPLSRLMATARMIVYKPEPIKCVEAVFIALYLTAGLHTVNRIPLGFKTQFANKVFLHLVVLVQHNGKYGAFGISRSPDLMNKDFVYKSMSSIVKNFKKAYEESDHTVLKIQIGLPVEHNIMSPNFVCWRHLCLAPTKQSWPECAAAIQKHASRMKHLWDLWVLAGNGGDPHRGIATKKPPLNNGLSVLRRKEEVTLRDSTPPHRKHVKHAQHATQRVQAAIAAPGVPQTRLTAGQSESAVGSSCREDSADGCENCKECEQLRKSVPSEEIMVDFPSTAALTRLKNLDNQMTVGRKKDTLRNRCNNEFITNHDLIGPPQKPTRHRPAWDIESLDRDLGECEQLDALAHACASASTKSRHRNLSVAARKKLLKNMVNESLNSTPQSSDSCNSNHKKLMKAGLKRRDHAVLKNRSSQSPGPLYNVFAKKSRPGY